MTTNDNNSSSQHDAKLPVMRSCCPSNDFTEGEPSGKDHAKNYIGKVCWEVIGYHICVWYENEWWSPGRMSYSPDKLEVIGNIHENPELCRS